MKSKLAVALAGSIALLLAVVTPASAETAEEAEVTSAGTTEIGVYNVLGEPPPLAGARSPRAGTPTVVTFDGYGNYAWITDQFIDSHSIRFGGDTPFTIRDGSNPASPVLSGYPLFHGSITGEFVRADGARYTVDHFSVDIGYIDVPGAVSITAYNLRGEEIVTVPVTLRGIVTVNVTHEGMASFRVFESGVEPAGWAIDTVTYLRPPAEAARYVALGDSYQSGEGAKYGPEGGERPYIAGTDTATNWCHRSDWAYPALLLSRGVAPGPLDFRACSGAVIDQLYRSEPAQPGEPPFDDGVSQMSALTNATELVTLGIGGNDLGFASVVRSCVGNSLMSPYVPYEISTDPKYSCQGELGDNVTDALKSLESKQSGKIGRRMLDVYSDVRGSAPNARIVVVSYPRFFPKGGAGQSCGLILRPSDQVWMNYVVERADTIIGDLVDNEPPYLDLEYVNMADVLAGHEQCTDREAMNGVMLRMPPPEIDPGSYHPNRLGHQLMANRIEGHLGTSVAPTGIVKPGITLSQRFPVAGGRLTVKVTWPGSDVVTSLVSPSGARYERESSGDAEHDNGPTWEYYTIEDPEPGEWTVEMFGADVDPEGEPVTLKVVDTPQPNAEPTGSIVVTQLDENTFRFDASGSSDADGEITGYRWDFGDGNELEPGKVVEHTFSAGQYRVALVVEDNKGALGFAVTESLVEVETPAQVAPGVTIHSGAGSAAQFTNQLKVAGDVRVVGDLECNSQAQVGGALTVTGKAHLTNDCVIGGDLVVGGDLVLDSTPQVDGNVTVGGGVRMQSTATIGGSVTAGGGFTVIDGLSIDDLVAKGSVGGTVHTDADVPQIQPMPYDPAVVEGEPSLTWRQWVNAIATENSAPSWSQGLSGNPGCVIAPWSSSVNGTDISVTTPLTVDARRGTSNCKEVRLQGMTVNLSADLTLYVDGFAAVNGLNVVSADGEQHRLDIVVPGEGSGCQVNPISLGASTVIDSSIEVALKTPGRVTVHGPSSLGANIDSGCFSSSGAVNLTRE